MRLVLAAAVLLLAATPAAAQLGSALDLVVTAPAEPLGPEAAATVHLRITRTCQSAIQVLPEGSAALRVEGLAGSNVMGPMEVTFPQQVCATSSPHEENAVLYVTLPANATPLQAYLFTVVVTPNPGSLVAQAPPEVRQDFVLSQAAPPVVAEPEPEPVKQEMPGPVPALLALGLLAAVALRRR